MFNFLKGKQVEMQVELVEPSRTYYPGDRFGVRVTLKADAGLEAQEAVVTFGYVEHYQAKRRERVRRDNRTREVESEVWLKDEQELARQVLLAPGKQGAAIDRTWEYEFTIPPEAPPTLEGKIVRVQWLVRGKIDIKLATDINAEAEVRVGQRAPGQRTAPSDYSESEGLEDASAAIQLPRQEWRAGETIDATLVLKPASTLDVSGVRAVVVRWETVTPYLGNNAAVEGVPVAVRGGTKFEAGQSYELPFQIKLPDAPGGVIETSHSQVVWFLKVVLDRRLRSDMSVTAPLWVYPTD
jgi:hypothetical protein